MKKRKSKYTFSIFKKELPLHLMLLPGVLMILVYMGTLENAMQERNVDTYLDSRKLNIDCKNAIEQAISDNFDGMSLNPGAAVAVVEKYGEERVAFVLANTLKQLSYDGRFSDFNKQWAE